MSVDVKANCYYLLIVLGVLVHYSSIQPEQRVPINNASKVISEPVIKPMVQTQALRFECDGRQYCSQMRSSAEADFFLKNCPDTKMDGDNDGIPCERQFDRF